MIVHAASDFRVGMGKQISICAPLYGKNRVRDLPRFDAHCKEKRRLFRTAVQDGQAVHACKFAKKEYSVQTRRAKRAYTKYQKAAFLDKLFNKNPELHAMLRQPKCTQPTPLMQPAWNAYLNWHFRPSAARGVQPRGLGVGSGLSARLRHGGAAWTYPPPQKFCYNKVLRMIGCLLLTLLIPRVATPCLPW